MGPRTRASLLWGAVAGLAFLVLVQGYDLVVGLSVSILARLGVAVAVGAAGAVVSYAAEPWLAARLGEAEP
jgi:hypothetical protein